MKSLLIFILLGATSAAHSAPDVHLFDYDSKAALDFHDNGAQDVGGIKVQCVKRPIAVCRYVRGRWGSQAAHKIP